VDPVSESRLTLVHSALSSRIHALANDLSSDGVNIRITQGWRSYASQNALYAQGRSLPGPIVTDAPGGYSAHNFGYAVDFVDMLGRLPDWDRNDPQWQDVLAKALLHGLAEGAQWEDYPHLYLRELPATPGDNFRSLFRNGGMTAVFGYINGVLTI
jgi:peptidoglycan L-alanyl-D-glutamate endopeptidase CwlK